MKSENVTKLWTFQSETRLRQLLCDGFLLGNWEQAIRSHDKEAAYRYMSFEMATRGLLCGDHPPVWAWHSCGGYQSPPDHEVARMLLSDHEITNFKVMLLSLECPTNQFLPSDYSAWCDYYYFPPLLADLIDSEFVMPSEEEIKSRLFDINYCALNSESLIQATLPVIQKDYLVKVHRVVLDNNKMVNIINN